MESGELAARAWAPGTDFPAPDKLNWMYHLGLSIICIMWILSLIVIVLRIWTRWTAKQLGIGKSGPEQVSVVALPMVNGWGLELTSAGVDDALIVAAMVSRRQPERNCRASASYKMSGCQHRLVLRPGHV